MKRKFLSISCCFFLSLSLMCCSQVKSSLDGDDTSSNSEAETLINDALSVNESASQDSEITTSDSDVTTSENSEEDSNTSSVVEKTTTTSSNTITTTENLSATEESSTSSQTYRLFFYNPVDGTRYYVD
ncbi:MAG: hypothetical protein WAQ55_04185, partial [Clostridium sp.]